MHIKIPIGALSINKASRGRKIKTPAYIKFEQDVSLLLPFAKGEPLEGELFVKCIFYLKNYANSDEDNCRKLIQDLMVKRGYLKDDRYIKGSYCVKEKVEEYRDEKIVMDIVRYEERMSVILDVH